MVSWPVLMKFKWTLGERNMSVFALTVRWLWEPFRLLKHLHWYDNAKSCWMISLPNTQWHCIGFLDVLGCEETKLPTGLQRTGLFRNLSPETSLGGVSTQNIKNKIKCWVDNQHLATWHGPSSTWRQAWKLISGPSPTIKTRLLTFNRTHSRAVIGLPTGHNTLWRHLYLTHWHTTFYNTWRTYKY